MDSIGHTVNIRDEIGQLSAEHDRMMVEHEQWMARREAAGAAPVQKYNDSAVLYREHDGNASEPTPQRDAAPSEGEQQDWSGWEKWLRGHLNNERAEMLEAVAQGMAMFVDEQLTPIDRTFAELRAENIELKGLITDALSRFAKIDDAAKELASEIGWLRQQWQADKRETQIRNQAMIERSGRVADLQRENAASRAALERQRFEQAFVERDHRIEQLETRLGMLLKFLGGDLPRGFWGRTDDAA